MVNTALDFGRKEGHTLSIKKDFILEVWQFKHSLQFRDVLLSVRSHCVDPPSTYRDSIPLAPTPTLFVVTDEYHFSQ
jgi:hypothetical protein